MKRKLLTILAAIFCSGVSAHTHDFSKREILVYSEISSHAFKLTNRNHFSADFEVFINDKKIGKVKDVQPNEGVVITVDLETKPNTIERKYICTLMKADIPNVTQVCSTIILTRL